MCWSNIGKELPPHSHSENNLKDQLLDNLLRRQLSQTLLKRQRDFKRIHSATLEKSRERAARSQAY